MNAGKRFSHGSVETIERDARQWGVTKEQAFMIMAVPVMFVLLMAATIPSFDVFFWLTAEDGLIEWLQVLMLFLSSLFFAWIGAESIRRKEYIGLLCLPVALGIFFVAGEEISWGQRLLGWETPETFQEINAQNETTLHNISWAHELFIYAVMLVGMYGTIMPLARLALPGKWWHSAASNLFIPPLFLVPAFLMPFAYRLVRLLFPLESWFPHLAFPITKFSEITELCLYFGILLFSWLNFRHALQAHRIYHLANGTQ